MTSIAMLLLCTGIASLYSSAGNNPGKIIIQNDESTSGISFYYTTATFSYSRAKHTPIRSSRNGVTQWVIISDKPVLLSSPHISGKSAYDLLVEAGDSIHMEIKNGEYVYSGNGADKFNLLADIRKNIAALELPANSQPYSAKSVSDYLEWNAYTNDQAAIVNQLMDKRKNKLSATSFHHLKYSLLSRIEDSRIKKFNQLRKNAEKFGVTNSDLCIIFDSSVVNNNAKWLLSTSSSYTTSVYYYEYIRTLYNRKHNFNNADSIRLNPARKLAYYNLAKEHLKGDILGQYISFLIPSEVIKEEGYNDFTRKILEDLDHFQGFEEYKKYIRKKRDLIIATNLQKGKPAPLFELVDNDGNGVSTEKLRGKIVILYIAGAENKEGKDRSALYNELKNRFIHDSMIRLVRILPGSLKTKKADINELEIYAGRHYPFIKQIFSATDHPKYHIISPDGMNVLSYTDTSGSGGKVNAVIAAIQSQQLAATQDGPYVFHLADHTSASYISGNEVRTTNHSQNKPVPLHIRVTIDDSLHFHTSGKYPVEAGVFERPDSILAISDIEGSFDALRQLLISGKVIDEQHNWIFGKNHLVLLGDFFDRGKQVTECLWLLYALEQRAREAGGRVHFLLGNHEIMNLTGDLRYVNRKYAHSTSLLKRPYADLFSNASELGKWLRSKNIMIKIGDILFVHGGISREMNALGMSIEQINDIARICLSDKTQLADSLKNTAGMILNADASPVWHRKYYKNNTDGLDMTTVIDHSLQQFNVKRIVTGHTVVSNTITTHYAGKVINIDTRHARGESEALLITGSKYYRISPEAAPQQIY